MKNLTIVLFATMLVSCGNKKAEIIEQIRTLKDSCNVIDENVTILGQEEKRKYNEIFHASEGRGIEKKINDLELMSDTVNNGVYMNYLIQNSTKKDELKARKKDLLHIIDSLELELKKY